jgi:hypothetical protein
VCAQCVYSVCEVCANCVHSVFTVCAKCVQSVCTVCTLSKVGVSRTCQEGFTAFGCTCRRYLCGNYLQLLISDVMNSKTLKFHVANANNQRTDKEGDFSKWIHVSTECPLYGVPEYLQGVSTL